MLKSIKYIGFYDVEHNDINRISSPAAVNKINYIAGVLNEIGYQVQIISPSWLKNSSNKKKIAEETIEISEKISVSFPKSWKSNNKISQGLKILFSMIWLFLYLVRKCKRNEKILVYHSPWLSTPIRLSRFFRRFKLILEVEEIYQDVVQYKKFFRTWENKLLKSADYYIFSTDLLRERLKTKKKSIILYGEYKIFDQLTMPVEDGKIHLLYAGIIDDVKRGAFNAIEAAKFLDDNYILHIIGFGEIDKLKKSIEQHNKTYDCKVFFDGSKTGTDYIKYCQKCHIGLSTQSSEGKYLKSSFPSKILSYLGMGLKVVSSSIDCVKKSDISSLVTYYDNDDGESISKAIVKSSCLNINSIVVINLMHQKFKNEFNNLISENL